LVKEFCLCAWDLLFLEFESMANLTQLARGDFSLGADLSAWVIVGIIALIVGGVWFLYRRTTVAVSRPLKLLLVSLKSAALVLLFLCLLQPLVIHSVPVPQKTYLAIMVDDSRSMSIRDAEGGRSRRDAAAELLYGKGGLIGRLQKNFELKMFRFDRDAAPLTGIEDLSASGSRSRLYQSMRQAGAELGGMSPSGLLLITDGADNGAEDPVRAAGQMGFPVFTVGVGREDVEKDIEIADVSTAKTILEDAIVEVHVTVRSRGYRKREVDLRIEEGEKIVAAKRISLENADQTQRFTLELAPEKEGPLVYTARIPELADEIVTENNRWAFLVDNTPKRLHILYIEGHPRNEYKYIRRAVEADKTLRLASYLQTGPQKFLRQGIASAEELKAGFPSREEDLFKYHAIVFGDIPKHFFTAEQLALVREFVSRRGGGFLMIGGSTAFDEAYIETPIADLLPVTLVPEKELPAQLRGGAGKGNNPTGEKFHLHLTGDGEQDPLLRMGPLGDLNVKWWEKMPALQGVNATGRRKAGATVLAVHPKLRFQNEPLPVIAYQRYGRGRTMAVATASTWRWQMLMPHDDTSHERFWRQILRWLAQSSQDRIELRLDRTAYSTGEDVIAQIQVFDKAFKAVSDATVSLKITEPDGIRRDIRLIPSGEKEGILTGVFTVRKEGVFEADISSETAAGKASETLRFLVSGPHVEYHNAAMDAAQLKRIAGAGGGRFYTVDDAMRITEDATALQKIITVKNEQDLWNIPAVLVFLILILGLEWYMRRQKGMS
jgi:uncharacterized membrane protein